MRTGIEENCQTRGMGLSICRSIIDAHGGLWAEANLSRGAVFQFTLSSMENELMKLIDSIGPPEEPPEDTAFRCWHS